MKKQITFKQLKRLVKEDGRKVKVDGSRAFTNALLEDAEEGLLSWESIARAALGYMSEDDVRDMAESDFEYEEDEEDSKVVDINGTELEEGDLVLADHMKYGEGIFTVDEVLDDGTVELSNDEVASFRVQASSCEWMSEREAQKWKEDNEEELEDAMDKANPDTYEVDDEEG